MPVNSRAIRGLIPLAKSREASRQPGGNGLRDVQESTPERVEVKRALFAEPAAMNQKI